MSAREPLSMPDVDWRRVAGAGLWGFAILTAVILAARAAAGEFDVPVSPVVPALVTGLTTLGSLIAWLLICLAECADSAHPFQRVLRFVARHRLASGLLSLTPPAMTAWATTVNSAPLSHGLVMGLLVLGLTVVVVTEGRQLGIAASQCLAARPPVAPPDDAAIPVVDELRSVSRRTVESDVIQHLARRRGLDGTESIDAVLEANFIPGGRQAVLHLPIHPVLPAAPEVECEPLDSSPVTASVTAAHPYGIRIEVSRTAETGRGLRVLIGVEIHAQGPAANVA